MIHVLDLDMTKSDLIGLAEVSVKKLIVNNGVDTQLELKYKKKPAGLLHVKTQWFPDMDDAQKKAALMGGLVRMTAGGQGISDVYQAPTNMGGEVIDANIDMRTMSMAGGAQQMTDQSVGQ